DWTGLKSCRGNARARRGHLAGGRHVHVIRRRDGESLSFVVPEEERLVSPDRSAERAAVLLVLHRRCVAARALDEEVWRVGPAVVTEVVGAAVRDVAAALHHDIDRAAALDAELGRRGL